MGDGVGLELAVGEAVGSGVGVVGRSGVDWNAGSVGIELGATVAAVGAVVG